MLTPSTAFKSRRGLSAVLPPRSHLLRFLCLVLSFGLAVTLITTAIGKSTTTTQQLLQPRDQDKTSSRALLDCLGTAKLTVVAPSLSDAHTYHQASASDNSVFHYNPAAIVYARSAEDVQAAMSCASADGTVAVAARSGGHSFGAYGSGGQDGSLIIDVGALNDTVSDPVRGVAHIGTGTRLGDVVKELWHQRDGKRGIGHGTCPTVGTGGHALCGGFGPTSRAWGMTMDHILEADVVLANGTLVTATETAHSDLLWALRGSGTFMGIVTRFLFQTHDASAPTVFFEYRWVPSLWTARDAANVFIGVQSFAQSEAASEDLGFHIQFQLPQPGDPEPLRGHPLAMHVRGTFLGPQTAFEAKKKALFQELQRVKAPLPDMAKETENSYLQTMEKWDDFGPPDGKLDTQAERKRHNNFIAKSLLTLDHRQGVSASSALEMFEFLWRTGPQAGKTEMLSDGTTSTWSVYNVYFEFFGGRSAAFRTAEMEARSSFPWRDAMWLVQVAVGTAEANRLSHNAHVYIRTLYGVLSRALHASGLRTAAYSCYVDPEMEERQWRDEYYGPSLQRLERLKADLDPRNLLRNPQSLGNATQISRRWMEGEGTSEILGRMGRRSGTRWAR